ncbi:MAG: phage tail tape measure protein [Pirellulales bacterium]
MGTAGAIRAGRAFIEIFADDAALRKGLARARASLSRFAASASVLGGTFSKGFRDAAATVNKLGQSLTTVGTQLGLVAAGAGLGLADAVREFKEFDTQMLTVQGILRQTGEDMIFLRDRAKELGRTTSFSATEVAEGMVELARAGRDNEQIWIEVESVMNLARGTMIEMADAVRITVSTLNQFGLSSGEAERVADTLVATANSATTTVEELGFALKFVAPIAAELGISLEETTATLGLLANRGIKATVAGTQLARVLKEINQPSKRSFLEDELGIIIESQGKFVGITKLFEQLNDAFGGLTAGKKFGEFNELFGRGSVVASILAKSGTNLNDLTKKIISQRGAAEDLRKTIEDGLFGAFEKLKSALRSIQLEFTEKIEPTLIKLSRAFTVVARQISDFVKTSSSFAKQATAWVAAFGGLSVGILAAGLSIKLFATSVGALFSIVELAVLPITIGVKVLVGLLSVGLVGAMTVANVAFAALTTTVGLTAAAINSLAIGLPIVGAALVTAGAAVGTFLLSLPAALSAFAIFHTVAIASAVLNNVVELFRQAKDGVIAFGRELGRLTGRAVTIFQELGAGVAEAFSGVTFKRGLETMVSDFNGAFKLIKNTFLAGDIENAWQATVASLKLLWADFLVFMESNGITEAFVVTFNAIKRASLDAVTELKIVMSEIGGMINQLIRWKTALTKSVFEEIEDIEPFNEGFTAVQAGAERARNARTEREANKKAERDRAGREKKNIEDAGKLRAGLARVQEQAAEDAETREADRLREAARDRFERTQKEAKLLSELFNPGEIARRSQVGGGSAGDSAGTFSSRLAKQILVASQDTIGDKLDEGNQIAADTLRVIRNSGIGVGMA